MRRCPLDACDGDGLIVDEATNTSYDCECRPALIAERKVSALASVIPERYRSAAFDRWPVTEIDPKAVKAVRAYADAVAQRLEAGEGLWLAGPVGTGKTTLAMLVAMAAARASRTVAIYSVPSLLNAIRNRFDADHGPSHVDLLRQLATVDLLHLDDLGAEKSTLWVLEELYAIVNARYQDRRAVVVTSNLVDRRALVEQLGERTVSRLREMCALHEIDGIDLRSGVLL